MVVKSYNELSISKTFDEISSYEIEFNSYVGLPNGKKIELVNDDVGNSNNICRLNSKEISLPLIIRTRRFGDRIFIKGMNGSKKIKDIFIDKKIKLEDRDNWPVVTDSSGKILWIPGIKKSKFDKRKNESYDIIVKYS